MAGRRRRTIDWRAEWITEQIEAEEERRNPSPPPSPPERERDERREIIVEPRPLSPAEGQSRVYVVQACQWREDWDECACWSPEAGRAIRAFTRFARARHHARREQHRCGERFGVVELYLDRPLASEVYLVKHSFCTPPDPTEGRIVAAFANRFEADQAVLRSRRSMWRYWCGTPSLPPQLWEWEWTSLPPALIRDLLLDLDLSPPEEEGESQEVWLPWWQRTAPLTNDWQRDRLLAAMDRWTWDRVVPVPLDA